MKRPLRRTLRIGKWPKNEAPCHGQRSPACGFTLVELLVVIAIIGLMVGLLMPAVQASREAARRMSCSNNLRQIGLSTQNYHSAFRQFPPGYVSHATSDGSAPMDVRMDPSTWDAGPGWGWAAAVLPFAEGNAIFGGLQMDQPIWASVNEGLVSSTVPMYLCPSATGGD